MSTIPVRVPRLYRNDVYVIVQFDRGAIDDVELIIDRDQLKTLKMIRFSRWAALYFLSQPRADGPAEVIVTGRDLAGPHPARTSTWVQQADSCSALQSPCAGLESWAETLERDSFMSADAEEARAARYFQDLDSETNPALFNGDVLKRCIRPECDPATGVRRHEVSSGRSAAAGVLDAERKFRAALVAEEALGIGQLLWSRLMHRAFGGGPVPGGVESPARVAYLSALQLGILNDHYGWRSTREIARAYAAFACGDLYLKLFSSDLQSDELLSAKMLMSNGGPNSDLVFCFAEFAFLSIEMGIDASAWRRLLPALVAVQELYALAYGDLDEQGRIIPIDSPLYRGREVQRPVTSRERWEIAHRYEFMSVESLLEQSTQNLRSAIAAPSPKPLRALP